MKVATECVVCGSVNLASSPAALAPFVSHRVYGWVAAAMGADGRMGIIPVLCNSIECKDCGFIFCDARFDDQEMARLYANYRDEEYIRLRDGLEPGYRALNAVVTKPVSYLPEIEALIPERPRRVLDWGGDTGTNTPFKDADIDIYDIGAVEPQFGRRVTEPLPPYDLIVCSNVLEHIPYPCQLLRQIIGTMDAGTLLYLEVPLEGPDTHIWHEHINIFSERSLMVLLEVCGLKTVNVKSIPAPDFPSVTLEMVVCRV